MDQRHAIGPGGVAVITGGAGGIGLAVAQRLGGAGMRLLLADIDEAALAGAANDLRGLSAHLLIPGFHYTGFTRRRGIAKRASAAWTAEQVADSMLARRAAGDFYIQCPDNDVSRAMVRG